MDVSKSFLRHMTETDLEWWFLACSDEHIPKGTTLIEEGSEFDSIYFVNSGRLDVFLESRGKEPIDHVGAGGILGEMSYLDEVPASASVVASEDSLLRVLPKESLTSHIADDSGFGLRFYRAVALAISQRLRVSHRFV